MEFVKTVTKLESIHCFLILNFRFWGYYVASRAYARKPPFNHLDLTSLESTLPRILTHNFHLSLIAGITIEQG